MNTVPDDVLLRIIEASEGYEAKGFHPRDIRIHCKNYFEHILPNWDNVVAKFRAGQEWMQDATTLLRDHKLLEAAEGVLLMLKNTKTVLERNSKRIIPK